MPMGGNPQNPSGDSQKGKELYEHALRGVAAAKKPVARGGARDKPGPAANSSKSYEYIFGGDYLAKEGVPAPPMKPEPIKAAAIGRRIAAEKNAKSSFPRTEKSSHNQTNAKCRHPMISSPSLAGQTAIVNQAVLLAPVHRSPTSSHAFGTVTLAGSLAVTVAGPRRTSTGFPIKSCDA